MSIETRNLPDQATEPAVPIEADDPRRDWYDRSSLVGDFMVMIADQTEEDYLRRAPENRTCEYIDGVVYMPSPAELWHQFELQLLCFVLEGLTAQRQSGIVLTGPAALPLRPECFLEPDAMVIPCDGERPFQGVYCDPPALLVIEILSKSTRSHDLNRKAMLYREAGTLEVWFVDLRDRALIVHRRTEDGYEVDRIEAGPYLSQALPGFWINASWLWERPRPNVLPCLELVLAGPPA